MLFSSYESGKLLGNNLFWNLLISIHVMVIEFVACLKVRIVVFVPIGGIFVEKL